MNYVNFWDEICNSFQQCAQKTAWCQGISPLLHSDVFFAFNHRGFLPEEKFLSEIMLYNSFLHGSHLKDELGTAEVCFLLLPKIIRFYNQGNMNFSRKGFLKGF